MRLPVVPLALLLVAACGGGPQESTGRVSDVAGRLCLQTTIDDGTCFAARDEQLRQVRLGDCATVVYSVGSGVTPTADEVRLSPGPCAAGPG